MNLLLALDIHEDNRDALLHEAVRWARRLGSALDVLYVDEYAERTAFLTDPVLVAQRDEIRGVHEAKLDAVMSSLPAEVRGTGLLQSGLAHEVIGTVAEGRPALLIGTHGRRALKRVAWGSVAERVVRLAPCPVVVLRPQLGEGEAAPDAWRLLLAVDIHEADVETVVARGAGWAADLRGVLDLLWIDDYEYAAHRIRDASIRTIVLEQWARAREADLEALDGLLERVPPPQRGQARRVDGRAAAEIVKAAPGYDALLIATRGSGGLRRLFLGSVAERVVRLSSNTVVVVRSTEATGDDAETTDPSS
ncbi:MAG: universal stress protein [Myxococcota bacterium]